MEPSCTACIFGTHCSLGPLVAYSSAWLWVFSLSLSLSLSQLLSTYVEESDCWLTEVIAFSWQICSKRWCVTWRTTSSSDCQLETPDPPSPSLVELNLYEISLGKDYDIYIGWGVLPLKDVSRLQVALNCHDVYILIIWPCMGLLFDTLQITT